MSAKYPSETIIAFENAREAALYFDNVIDFTSTQPADKWINDSPLALARDLAPLELRENKDFLIEMARSNLMLYIAKQVKDKKERREFLKELKFLSAKKVITRISNLSRQLILLVF